MLVAFALVGAVDGAPTLPAYAIPNSEVRDVVAKSGRHYQLLIGLPADYAKHPEKKYPVVYVTDGYWDFQKLTAIEGSLVYDKEAPEYITVGLSYTGQDLNYGDLRRWELSPVAIGEDGPEKSGHAADFLKTIETEIIPLVEREYRADPAHRVLGGASLGGLFTLFAMYTRPEVFEGYVAVTPAVVLGNDWLLGYEEAFVKGGRAAALRGRRLFVSGGGDEWPAYVAGTRRYDALLRSAGRKGAYAGLAYQFRIIDGERHAGMQLDSYVRGVMWVLAPLAAERGQAKE